ncbi:hypothetical protein PG994_013536 [Apiospora phragmitis]|uniref:Heterokaryon incompatibility domain-containing protein n=1 Tax=Apiospora phragmitis TaxID=2905665 RepID=A0ABR1TBG7_9PEZI
MCYGVAALYDACRCLYYQNPVARCAGYGRPSHPPITIETIIVGYFCANHSPTADLTLDEHSWQVYDSLPLTQDEFRLLKLYPASTRQAPILIDLFKSEYGSPEVPRYDAISYRWDDPNDRRSLTANGRRISVTCSLHTALTYMRWILD